MSLTKIEYHRPVGPMATFEVDFDTVLDNEISSTFHVNDGASYTWEDVGRYANRIKEDVIFRYQDDNSIGERDFIPVLRSTIIQHIPYLKDSLVK